MTTPNPPATAAAPLDALRDRIEMAQRAVDITAAWLGRDAVAGIKHDVERISQRLALGIDSTVVALLGGTGSGKSSLFNAVSGLQFADVGVRRPTTQDATACVWGRDASALLDWLGVAKDRRIKRESELDADDQADLRGLVLLDMPDHDSVVAEHREKVDRVLPLADLLVWVVDPQKYADDALHSGYLATLRGHETSMLVVLNQTDRVRRSAVPELVDDVRRLLDQDGLEDLPILATSVRSGDGIDELRARLAELVARQSSAVARARAELGGAIGLLAELTGAGGTSNTRAARDLVVDELIEVIGLDRLADRMEASEQPGDLVRPDLAAATRVLDHWLAALDTGSNLGAWRLAVARALPSASDLQGRLSDVVARIGSPDDVTATAKGKSKRKSRGRKAADDFHDWAAGLLAGAIDEVLTAPTEQALAGLAKAREAVAHVAQLATKPE